MVYQLFKVNQYGECQPVAIYSTLEKAKKEKEKNTRFAKEAKEINPNYNINSTYIIVEVGKIVG
jgi:hypothetical protein